MGETSMSDSENDTKKSHVYDFFFFITLQANILPFQGIILPVHTKLSQPSPIQHIYLYIVNLKFTNLKEKIIKIP